LLNFHYNVIVYNLKHNEMLKHYKRTQYEKEIVFIVSVIDHT